MFVTQIVASKQIGISLQILNRMTNLKVIQSKPFGLSGTRLIDLDQAAKFREKADEIKLMSRSLNNNPARRYLSLSQLSKAFELDEPQIEKRIKDRNISTKQRNGSTVFSVLDIYLVLQLKPNFALAMTSPVEPEVEINWNEVYKARMHEPQPEPQRTSKKPTTPAEWSRALRFEWKRKFNHA